MLYLTGIVITFFLSVLLLTKKNKTLADKILSGWLISTGLHLSFFYIFITGNYVRFPYLLGLEIPMPLLQGPFLFLYTLAVTQTRRLTWKSSLHFLPFIIVLGIMTPFFGLSLSEKIEVYRHDGAGYEALTGGVLIALSISGSVYIILSFLVLRRHSRLIAQQFSNTDRINLNWLRYLIFGAGAIWIVILAGLGDVYIFGTVVLYVFFLGFFGIRQVGVFSSPLLVTEQAGDMLQEGIIAESPVMVPAEEMPLEPEARAEKQKYQHSALSETEGNRQYERVQQLMAAEKTFKSPELTLGDLAQELQMHPNVLSQVINTYAGKTFYDYINDLRIEEFKKIVAEPGNQQYTFLALAFECGFNSKTAFNRNFKKTTGLSPTQYIQQLNIAATD
jgi:AraC-like DNA-binding protein